MSDHRDRPDWLVPEPCTDTDLGVLKTGKEAQVSLVERTGADGRRCLLARKLYLPREVSQKGVLEAMGVQRSTQFRNDVAYLRRPAPGMLGATEPTALEPSTEATVNNVNSLIQRVAGTSLGEIENLISELEGLRDLLHAEGQRVQREISGYAQLSHAAMKSTRMIADNVERSGDGAVLAVRTARHGNDRSDHLEDPSRWWAIPRPIGTAVSAVRPARG